MKKLSIQIPSYNRAEKLTETLFVLVEQCLNHNVEICIIDNCSPKPIQEVVNENFPSYKNLITVKRNSKNIGGDANICRCLETASSEWIWLLGDDDKPDKNAVCKILDQINKVDSLCGYICFSTTMKRFETESILSGSADFWKFVEDNDAFRNMSFISSGVYRTEFLESCMSLVYNAIITCFTQIMAIRAVHMQGRSIMLAKEVVCEWQIADPTQHWSRSSVMFGIPLLHDFDGFGDNSKKSLFALFLSCRPRPWFRWVIHQSLYCKYDSRHYWSIVFKNIAKVARGKYYFTAKIGLILLFLRNIIKI